MPTQVGPLSQWSYQPNAFRCAIQSRRAPVSLSRLGNGKKLVGKRLSLFPVLVQMHRNIPNLGGLIAVLTVSFALTSCSGPSSPSPETTTARFLEAFAKTESSFLARATSPLQIEFSSRDGRFRYRHSLAYLQRLISNPRSSRKEGSALIASLARRAALTLPFVEKTTPVFSDPSEVAELFATIHASLHPSEAIELEGNLRYENLSTDRRDGNREGSIDYQTRSQLRHRGWTLFDYHPEIQPSDTPPYRWVSTGKRSYIDGLLVDAMERSGTSPVPEELPFKREASIREASPGFTNLNWEIGLSPFLPFYEILGSYGGSDFFSTANRERHDALNIAIEKVGERVRITLVSGVVGEGFSRTILVLDPSKDYALFSARTQMAVEEDLSPSLENVVEARDFLFAEAGDRKFFYPSHHRFELHTRDGFQIKGEHAIRSMRLLSDAPRSDFEITLDETWEIRDQRKSVANH